MFSFTANLSSLIRHQGSRGIIFRFRTRRYLVGTLRSPLFYVVLVSLTTLGAPPTTMMVVAAVVVMTVRPFERQHRPRAAPALHGHHPGGQQLLQAQRRPCAFRVVSCGVVLCCVALCRVALCFVVLCSIVSRCVVCCRVAQGVAV